MDRRDELDARDRSSRTRGGRAAPRAASPLAFARAGRARGVARAGGASGRRPRRLRARRIARALSRARRGGPGGGSAKGARARIGGRTGFERCRARR